MAATTPKKHKLMVLHVPTAWTMTWLALFQRKQVETNMFQNSIYIRLAFCQIDTNQRVSDDRLNHEDSCKSVSLCFHGVASIIVKVSYNFSTTDLRGPHVKVVIEHTLFYMLKIKTFSDIDFVYTSLDKCY